MAAHGVQGFHSWRYRAGISECVFDLRCPAIGRWPFSARTVQSPVSAAVTGQTHNACLRCGQNCRAACKRRGWVCRLSHGRFGFRVRDTAGEIRGQASGRGASNEELLRRVPGRETWGEFSGNVARIGSRSYAATWWYRYRCIGDGLGGADTIRLRRSRSRSASASECQSPGVASGESDTPHNSYNRQPRHGVRMFAVLSVYRRGANVVGKRILLVDDVMTTGSTASEASRTLRDAGAAEIVVAVLARR